MSVPKVSISVPVYNAEKYIDQCLQSLIKQTLQEIEIIIINDGSTDKTEEICMKYASRDERIKLISKKNEGIAATRQRIIEEASGEYLCSVDADDWIEPNTCELLYDKAKKENADIVLFDSWWEYGEQKSKQFHYGTEIPKFNDKIIEDALMGKFPCAVWNKLIRLDLFEKYNVQFQKGVNLGEDYLVILKFLQHPIIWAYCPEPLYHYRRMPGDNSYTNNITLKSYDYLLRVHEWIDNNIDKNSHRKGICHDLINIAFAGLRVREGMTTDYYKKTSVSRISVMDLIREHSLKSMVVLWTKLFGYKAGLFLYTTMYKSFYK